MKGEAEFTRGCVELPRFFRFESFHSVSAAAVPFQNRRDAAFLNGNAA